MCVCVCVYDGKLFAREEVSMALDFRNEVAFFYSIVGTHVVNMSSPSKEK